MKILIRNHGNNPVSIRSKAFKDGKIVVKPADPVEVDVEHKYSETIINDINNDQANVKATVLEPDHIGIPYNDSTPSSSTGTVTPVTEEDMEEEL